MTSHPVSPTFCDQCGHRLEGRFCASCGAMVPVDDGLGQQAGSNQVGAGANPSTLSPPPTSQGYEQALETPVVVAAETATCAVCGAVGIDTEFCGNCGARRPNPVTVAAGASTAGFDGTPAAAPDGNPSRQPAQSNSQAWSEMDKGTVKEAVFRTAGAWAGVWLVLCLAFNFLSAIGSGDSADDFPLSVPGGASALQLLGMGSRPAVVGGLAGSADRWTISSISMVLVSVTLLQFVALRLAQARRPVMHNLRPYAVISCATSVAAILLLTQLASPSGQFSPPVRGITVEYGLAWSWVVPVLVSIGLTLLVVYGLPQLPRVPELRRALSILGRLAFVLAWLGLMVAIALATYQGLSLGTSASAGGLGALPGFCILVLLAIPYLVIGLLGAMVQVPPHVFYSDPDRQSTIDSVNSFLSARPWLYAALGIVVFLIVAYWLTNPTRARVSSRLWMWTAGVFAVAGLLFGWVFSLKFQLSLVDERSGASTIDGTALAWRMALVGAALGLLLHPAVLPTVARWRGQLPAFTASIPVPQRVRQAWAGMLEKQPILADAGETIGRTTRGFLWGIAALFVVAVLAVPVGKVMAMAFGDSPQDSAGALRNALESGDGQRLQQVTGGAIVPVSTRQPVGNVQVTLDSEGQTAKQAPATVSWDGIEESQSVYLESTYGGFLGIIPRWKASTLAVPVVSGASNAAPPVTVDGQRIGTEGGAPVMPGTHDFKVESVGKNVTWTVRPLQGVVVEDLSIFLDAALTPEGESSAKTVAVEALGQCTEGSNGCPSSFNSWPNGQAPAVAAEAMTVQPAADAPGVFWVTGPLLSYNANDGYGNLVPTTEQMSVPLQLDANGQWQVFSGTVG